LSLSGTNDNSKCPQTSMLSLMMSICHHSSLPAIDNHRMDSE
jgi:hypothetical protein